MSEHHLIREVSEWRRLRAVALHEQGWPEVLIAEALDVNKGTVSRWLAVAKTGGVEALRVHPGAGHPPKLTPEQLVMLPEFLWHGAEAYGFRGDVWTCPRIAQVIRWEFGVSYHKDHVSRLMKELGWTPQIPITRDHLSVMAGFTPAGKVYTLVRPESLSSTHSVVFLEHLLRQTGKRLLVIWDGSPIHRWKAVQEWLASGGAKRAHLEMLPGYAPDLNPLDAGGWHHLKHVEMRNLSCMDLEELHLELHLAIGRLRQKPHLIHSFFVAAGLTL